jgi:hypothetical protein
MIGSYDFVNESATFLFALSFRFTLHLYIHSVIPFPVNKGGWFLYLDLLFILQQPPPNKPLLPYRKAFLNRED